MMGVGPMDEAVKPAVNPERLSQSCVAWPDPADVPLTRERFRERMSAILKGLSPLTTIHTGFDPAAQRALLGTPKRVNGGAIVGGPTEWPAIPLPEPRYPRIALTRSANKEGYNLHDGERHVAYVPDFADGEFVRLCMSGEAVAAIVELCKQNAGWETIKLRSFVRLVAEAEEHLEDCPSEGGEDCQCHVGVAQALMEYVEGVAWREFNAAGEPGPVVTVRTCARCGADHKNLPARRLDNPPDQYTHWMTCPATGQPILLTFTPDSPPANPPAVD